jgi:hypothetical protein
MDMGNTEKPNVQGEGDYEAARRYRKDVKDFVDSHDIDKAAHDAAPHSADEAREMEEAERAGKSHSKAGKEREMNLKSEKGTKQ